MATGERPIREEELAAQTSATMPESVSTPGGTNLDRFTPKSRQVLAEAAEQARQLGHAEIQPEHLLLALLLEPENVILRPLRAAAKQVDLANLREILVARLEKIEPNRLPGLAAPSGLSDGCKQVLETALKEANRLRSAPVGPAHLLLGLVVEGSALAGSSVVANLAARGLQVSIGSRAWRPAGPSQAMAAGPNIHPSPGEPRGPERADTRDNVITFRVTDSELAAVDALVDSGAMRTRSEASAWLLQSGITANQEYFDQIRQIGEEITRLRQEVQRLTEAHIGRATTREEEPGATIQA